MFNKFFDDDDPRDIEMKALDALDDLLDSMPR